MEEELFSSAIYKGWEKVSEEMRTPNQREPPFSAELCHHILKLCHCHPNQEYIDIMY
ncbi:unnamed protein product [Leuciscus chuanchicus]